MSRRRTAATTGSYVKDIAAEIVANDSGILDLARPQQQHVAFRELGYRDQLAVAAGQPRPVRHALRRLVLRADAARVRCRRARRSRSCAPRATSSRPDGAVWLRTTDFGDDKDRVLVKADGELTYFASDTAYYVDKRDRGDDLCIYLLGADHHGYVNRLRAVAACAGDDPDATIEVLIGQLVKMVKGGAEVRLSKRAGKHHHDRRPGRRGRRRRGPVLA